MGDLEVDYDDYRNRYRTNVDEEGKMGEIHEEYSELDYWMKGGIPSLGKLDEDAIHILNPIEYNDQSPIEEEEEGYTGNAGMTMQYWYHYGAVVLFPLDKLDVFLENQSEDVVLDWLNYVYSNKEFENIQFISSLINSLPTEANTFSFRRSLDYSSFTALLTELKNESLFLESTHVIINNFENIDTQNWIELLTLMPTEISQEIITKVICRNECGANNKYLDLLAVTLIDKQKNSELMLSHFDDLIGSYSLIFTSSNNIENNDLKNKLIEKSILILVTLKSEHLTELFFEKIRSVLNRDFIHHIAFPALVNLKEKKSIVSQKLAKLCITELDKYIHDKPQPPGDWKRDFPKFTNKNEEWNLLIPFLNSATLEQIEYKRVASDRERMENLIRYAEIDLQFYTIKKGSPHTMVIKKNNKSFDKNYIKWLADLDLRKAFNPFN